MFVFDVMSLPFSFPVGDVSDGDDAVTDVILFSCIFFQTFLSFRIPEQDSDGGEKKSEKT